MTFTTPLLDIDFVCHKYIIFYALYKQTQFSDSFEEFNMRLRIPHFFRKPVESDNLLTEFEDTLMLIVDPEQLTNNLLSKLKELISVGVTV